jgi:hypothetical protein
MVLKSKNLLLRALARNVRFGKDRARETAAA